MLLRHVSLGGLRVLAEADFFPATGISWLVGSNGSGKTTVLEGLFALGHARSFRAAQFDSVLRHGCDEGHIATEWVDRSGVPLRLGSARQRRGGWEYRVEGAREVRAAEIAARAPTLCFEPGSHLIVSGPSERRRRLMDWGVFHVERMPSALWSEWQRVLRQRNEALRVRDLQQLDAFDALLATAGERLDRARSRLAERWLGRSAQVLSWLSEEVGGVTLEYRRGWGRAHATLVEALHAARERDMTQGFTSVGPHRADVSLRIQGVDAREFLSRGQSKILALSLLIGLSDLYGELHGSYPLLLLDDLCSELDALRAGAVLAYLRERGVQAIVTGVERPGWAEDPRDALFHVEQGKITPLL